MPYKGQLLAFLLSSLSNTFLTRPKTPSSSQTHSPPCLLSTNPPKMPAQSQAQGQHHDHQTEPQPVTKDVKFATPSGSQGTWRGDRSRDWYRDSTHSAHQPERPRKRNESDSIRLGGQSSTGSRVEVDGSTTSFRTRQVDTTKQVLPQAENVIRQDSAVIIFRQFEQLSRALWIAKGKSELSGNRGKARDVKNLRAVRLLPSCLPWSFANLRQAEEQLRNLSKQFEFLLRNFEDHVELYS